MAERVLQRVEDVVQREVAGEVFLVPIRGDLANMQELFALNEVGTWIWARLDGSVADADLVAGMAEVFTVDIDQASTDVQSFLDGLVELGLAREARGPG